MSGYSNVMSTVAAMSAMEASSQARSAKNAAEERLEGKTKFIKLQKLKLEESTTLKRGKNRWWHKLLRSSYKQQFVADGDISVKLSDISWIGAAKDDFGRKVAKVKFEERADFYEEYVTDTLDSLTKRLNKM